MTKIYVTTLQPIGKPVFDELIPYMDERARQKIQRFKSMEDKARTLLAHALTKMMLSQELHIDPRHISFTENGYGKYSLSGNQRYFNISHAGVFIVCAIGRHPVGIDIEKHEERDFRLFKDIWGETQEVYYPLEEKRSFYQVWTAKESYTKYLGIGLHANMQNIILHRNGCIMDHGRLSEACVRHIDVHPDYSCAVCCKEQIENVSFIGFERMERFFGKRNDRFEYDPGNGCD